MPSFVVTLAGLLAWNGVVLQIIGNSGTIVIQDKVINGLANDYMSSTLALAVLIVSVAGFILQQVLTVRARARAGLPNVPWSLILLRIVVLAGAGLFVVLWADTDRGLPYVAPADARPVRVLDVHPRPHALRAPRLRGRRQRRGRATRRHQRGRDPDRRVRDLRVHGRAGRHHPGLAPELGRHVHRRRLDPAVLDRRGGHRRDSLFGGRGNIRSAVLGGVVIGMIANGLGLLTSRSGTQFIVTGVVLLAAVTLDSLSRRRSAAAGLR